MNRAFFAQAYVPKGEYHEGGSRLWSPPCETKELAIVYAKELDWPVSETVIVGPVPVDYIERAPEKEETLFMLIAWAPGTEVIATGTLSEMKEALKHENKTSVRADWLSIIPCVCTVSTED